MKAKIAVWLTIALIPPAVFADPKAGATVAASFSGSVVSVTGITAGGEVAIDAALVEPRKGVYAEMRRVEQVVADTDRDGQVSYDLGRAVPSRSIWAIVDIATGSYVIATPVDYPRREFEFPVSGIKNTPSDQFDTLTHGLFLVQMLWVRPGEGAWAAMSGDGAAGDVDGRNNGSTTNSLGYLRPLGTGPAVPKKIKKDDILVLIDPFEMTFASTRVVK